MLCEICGINEATKQAYIPLWDYGVRHTKLRNICEVCKKAFEKGEL